ncbi:hypothetical protein [Streptomyces sp. cg40]
MRLPLGAAAAKSAGDDDGRRRGDSCLPSHEVLARIVLAALGAMRE